MLTPGEPRCVLRVVPSKESLLFFSRNVDPRRTLLRAQCSNPQKNDYFHYLHHNREKLPVSCPGTPVLEKKPPLGLNPPPRKEFSSAPVEISYSNCAQNQERFSENA